MVALSSAAKIDQVQLVPAKHYQFDKEYLLKNGCTDVDAIVHVGAWTPKTAGCSNDLEKSFGNIFATKALLEAKLPALKQIIYCSTLDVYGNSSDVISETTATIPATMYGWSKLYCEKMVEIYCKEHGLNYQILRIGHVFGEGEEKYQKAMPVMIKNALQGKDITIYGDGQAIRTFIHVEDVATAIVNALDETGSNIINVVGNETVTINELALAIREICDASINIQHIPVEGENRNCVFNNKKLMNSLLRELKPFRKGLQQEIAYMREQMKV